MTKMKVKITPNTYVSADGTSQLYLHASANSRRVRVLFKKYYQKYQAELYFSEITYQWLDEFKNATRQLRLLTT